MNMKRRFINQTAESIIINILCKLLALAAFLRVVPACPCPFAPAPALIIMFLMPLALCLSPLRLYAQLPQNPTALLAAAHLLAQLTAQVQRRRVSAGSEGQDVAEQSGRRRRRGFSEGSDKNSGRHSRCGVYGTDTTAWRLPAMRTAHARDSPVPPRLAKVVHQQANDDRIVAHGTTVRRNSAMACDTSASFKSQRMMPPIAALRSAKCPYIAMSAF